MINWLPGAQTGDKVLWSVLPWAAKPEQSVNNQRRSRSQLLGMCGFSLKLFRMCLKIDLGVFIYLCIYLFLFHSQIHSGLSRCCAFLR